MTAGIVGYGAYVPRLRMSRQAIYDANAWFAPGLKSKAKGSRSLANWDEDATTMAVAAARDSLPVTHGGAVLESCHFRIHHIHLRGSPERRRHCRRAEP